MTELPSIRQQLALLLLALLSFGGLIYVEAQSSPPMKVYVQWATNPARDWQQTDCASWPSLLKKSVPAQGRGQRDDDLGDGGWVMALMVVGTVVQGYDHYVLQPVPNGGCRVSVWNDDPEDFPQPYGEVWTFLPPARDPALDGRYNTRNWGIVYSDSEERRRDSMEFHPWREFLIPSTDVTVGQPASQYERIVRHGVWVSDRLFLEHLEVRNLHSWREWTEGLPSEDVVDGLIKREPARHSGHSVTRFLRDDAQVSGVHVASDELQMLSTAGGGETTSENVAAGADELAVMWTLNEEAGGAWENNATIVFELSTGTTDANGGFLSVGVGSDGHMACVNTGLTSDTEVHTQAQPAFTLDAGIETATFTGTWSTCNTTDKFEALLAVQCTAAHGNCSLTWIYDTDSSVTVPYPSAAAAVPKRRTTVFD